MSYLGTWDSELEEKGRLNVPAGLRKRWHSQFMYIAQQASSDGNYLLCVPEPLELSVWEAYCARSDAAPRYPNFVQRPIGKNGHVYMRDLCQGAGVQQPLVWLALPSRWQGIECDVELWQKDRLEAHIEQAKHDRDLFKRIDRELLTRA